MNVPGLTQALPRELVPELAGVEHRYDMPLLLATLTLLGLGLVMVASASISIAARETGEPLAYFYRQSIHVAIGLLVGAIALRIPLNFWRRTGPLLLLVAAVLLVLVLVPGIGREVNGSKRWITLGFTNLQPSEIAKVFVAVYLAGYLVRRSWEVRTDLRGFFKPVFVVGAIAVLLLLEPDYGATVVLFSAALGMLFLAGVPFVSFALWLAVIAALMGVVVLAEPYRVQRLLSFADPWADPFGSGFQLAQALIAIGRGDWFGVGLGAGVQKLFYLPEAHTDFLFAVLAEEFGLMGMSLVISLYAFVVLRSFAIARRAEMARSFFGAYLAYGLGLLLGLQAFVNIGVNLGLLPTKGLTLPLMSYGGSSVVVSCLSMAIILRIDHELRTLALGRGGS